MTSTLEAHAPLTEGTHGRHESEPVKATDETSELEKFAALLPETQAYRTMPSLSDAAPWRSPRVSSREAHMTVIIEGSPTTPPAGDTIQRPGFEASMSWARAAFRAHALLSQTMSDEEVDELMDPAVRFDQISVKLPPFLFG